MSGSEFTTVAIEAGQSLRTYWMDRIDKPLTRSRPMYTDNICENCGNKIIRGTHTQLLDTTHGFAWICLDCQPFHEIKRFVMDNETRTSV